MDTHPVSLQDTPISALDCLPPTVFLFRLVCWFSGLRPHGRHFAPRVDLRGTNNSHSLRSEPGTLQKCETPLVPFPSLPPPVSRDRRRFFWKLTPHSPLLLIPLFLAVGVASYVLNPLDDTQSITPRKLTFHFSKWSLTPYVPISATLSSSFVWLRSTFFFGIPGLHSRRRLRVRFLAESLARFLPPQVGKGSRSTLHLLVHTPPPRTEWPPSLLQEHKRITPFAATSRDAVPGANTPRSYCARTDPYPLFLIIVIHFLKCADPRVHRTDPDPVNNEDWNFSVFLIATRRRAG